MRLSSLFCLLLALAGISAAQDTNFSAGPQYLITSDSPLFLRPIATPSLSFEAPVSIAGATIEAAPAAPVVSTPPPIPGASLARIFWGEPKTSEVGSSEIEISSEEPPRALPASIVSGSIESGSIVDVGVTAIADVQSLREQGYGVTLGETASFWKTHPGHASRVYTNRDVERLHGG
jgi:hypothetical protein